MQEGRLSVQSETPPLNIPDLKKAWVGGVVWFLMKSCNGALQILAMTSIGHKIYHQDMEFCAST